jgi:hypothetical protein
MRRNYLIAAGIGLCVAVIAVLALPNKDQARPISLVSDDGVVSLDVPASALPPGTAAADLSVKKGEGTDEWEVYELGPDGTVFNGPVGMTIELSIAADVEGNVLLPHIRHVSANDDGAVADVLADMEARLDLATERLTVRSTITHFSQVWISKTSGQLAVSIAPPTPTEIGKPVSIPVKITSAKQAEPIFGPDHYVDPRYAKVQIVRPILYTTLEGAFEEKVKPQILAPAKTIFDKPALGTRIGPGDVVSFTSTDFTCAQEGKTNLEWYSFYNAYAEENDWWMWKMWVNIPVECVKEPVAAKKCEEYEGGYLKDKPACDAACAAQDASNERGIARFGKCHCLPVDDVPGCYIKCLGDACLESGE